jgi:hydrogenase 3 maturation protease
MKRMLLGVGNRLSHDDGVGPVIAAALHDSDWQAVDCGTSIENVAGMVVRERPDLLVVVDAARMSLPPGTFRRLPLGSHEHMLASTHGLPLSFVMQRMQSAAGRTVLIGVEPSDLTWGEGLSTQVAAAAAALTEVLRCGDVDAIPIHDPRFGSVESGHSPGSG